MLKQYEALSCRSKDFKKDISDLCESCELREKISVGMKIQIDQRARDQHEILNLESFKEYVRKEIESAQAKMVEAENVASGVGGVLPNFGGCTEIYLWNKERVKTLIKLLEEVNSNANNETDKEFLSNANNETDKEFLDRITLEGVELVAKSDQSKAAKTIYQKYKPRIKIKLGSLRRRIGRAYYKNKHG